MGRGAVLQEFPRVVGYATGSSSPLVVDVVQRSVVDHPGGSRPSGRCPVRGVWGADGRCEDDSDEADDDVRR